MRDLELSVRDLSLRWRDGVTALDGLTLALRPGEVVGLLGPNGAGKSSALRMIAGLERSTRGEVRVDGVSLRSMTSAARARAVSYLPQRESAPPGLRVRAFVELGRAPWATWSGRLGPVDRAAVDRAMARCALEPLARRELGTLSGGELRRCALARCIAQGTRYMLLDEPLASLDPHQQVAVSRIVLEAAADGAGVLIVLHELNVATQLCDRVVVLREGRVVADGPPAEALSARRVESVFPCRFHVSEGPAGAPCVVPIVRAPTGR